VVKENVTVPDVKPVKDGGIPGEGGKGTFDKAVA